MKKHLQFVSLLLLGLFAITLLPVNLLHHHAEDEHALYAAHAPNHAGHHCDLDALYCEPEVDHACGHDAHVHETWLTCFVCEFHFISHISSEPHTFKVQLPVSNLFYSETGASIFPGNLIRILNKGPPAV